MSLKSKKLFVDGRTYVRTHAQTDGHFKTGFIRSTLWKSRPTNAEKQMINNCEHQRSLLLEWSPDVVQCHTSLTLL